MKRDTIHKGPPSVVVAALLIAMAGCDNIGDPPCTPGDPLCQMTPDGDIEGQIDASMSGCEAQGSEGCEDIVDPCHGGILAPMPQPEVCDGVDNDCNDAIDDLGSCYQGPDGTLPRDENDARACRPGVWACNAATGVARCVGQVLPGIESQSEDDGLDEDCDGTVDEADIGYRVCDDVSCEGGSFSFSIDDLPPGEVLPVIVHLRAGLAVNDSDEAEIAELQANVLREISDLAPALGGVFRPGIRFGRLPAFVVEADAIALRLLWRHPDVRGIIANLPMKAAMTEASALIGAEIARRNGGANGRGIRVALLDSGIDYRHPAFGACRAVGDPGCRVVAGYDFIGGDDDPFDGHADGHGTMTAGVVAAGELGNEPGGIAPGAEIVALRVIGADGHSRLDLFFQALEWLLLHPELEVRVVQVGFATDSPWPGPCDADFQRRGGPDLVRALADSGVMIVAPSGNRDQARLVSFPACLSEVYSVGATYDAAFPIPQHYPMAPCTDGANGNPIQGDDIPCFSNGHGLPAGSGILDLFAPGAYIRSTALGGGYGLAAGTSYAAAMVAGAAAVLMSGWPAETVDDIKDRLEMTAVPLRGSNAAGRLQLEDALGRDCLDADGDGYGQVGPGCQMPLDCDDGEYTVYPGAPERCDHLNNDCDGSTDEGLGVGDICRVGVGACAVQGVQVCGGSGVVCDVMPRAPIGERCNGLDDDCDGSTDEGFGVGNICRVGVGACAAQGVQVCGAQGVTCSAMARAPVDEMCNGIDDDCDRRVDEATSDVSLVCDTGRPGICRFGTVSCNAGVEVCEEVAPGEELCGNRLDDDCDGNIDKQGLPEICDGMDDDCDGRIDEGVCGRFVESECRLWLGWSDNNAIVDGARSDWGGCRAQSSFASRNIGCTSTRGDGLVRTTRLQGDTDGNDRFGIALTCTNDGALGSWVQNHCALYLGWSDGATGWDRSANWLGCPGLTNDRSAVRSAACTSTRFRPGWFLPMRLGGDVDGSDELAVAWICTDPQNPALAASMSRNVEAMLGWVDGAHAAAPVDGSPQWPECVAQGSFRWGDARGCVGTRGDSRFHITRLGGDMDDNDYLTIQLQALR